MSTITPVLPLNVLKTQLASKPVHFLPVLLGCGTFLVVFAIVFIKTVKLLGHWYYPLDDAYIGMSLAKHFALYGVWGTSHEFASAASAPGFVVLLAAFYRVFGVSEYTPLALACASCLGIISATARLLRFASNRVQTAGVLLVVGLTPVWTMAALGMEHALQILLCLLFLDQATSKIADREQLDWRILVLASLMVAVRYEGLFVVAGACLLLLMQRRWLSAVTLGIFAWLPVIGFGIYFRMHGAEWLPNSVLLKGGASLYRIVDFLVYGLHMAPLMVVATWLLCRYRGSITDSRAKAGIGITAITLWLHLALASYGWVYRYEAYLIALGVASVVLLYAEDHLSVDLQPPIVVGLGVLAFHAFLATVTLPDRSRVIYSQQVQTARLLKIYPAPTAVNDLGAPTYFSNALVLDLVGLGSQDVFRARYCRSYRTTELSDLLRKHGVQTIAIYDKWFSTRPPVPWGGPPLPHGYILVAKLHDRDPYYFAGDDTVSYYAAAGSETRLRAALHSIEASLPSGDSLAFEQ
jgi:hypothetical protein